MEIKGQLNSSCSKVKVLYFLNPKIEYLNFEMLFGQSHDAEFEQVFSDSNDDRKSLDGRLSLGNFITALKDDGTNPDEFDRIKGPANIKPVFSEARTVLTKVTKY